MKKMGSLGICNDACTHSLDEQRAMVAFPLRHGAYFFFDRMLEVVQMSVLFVGTCSFPWRIIHEPQEHMMVFLSSYTLRAL